MGGSSHSEVWSYCGDGAVLILEGRSIEITETRGTICVIKVYWLSCIECFGGWARMTEECEVGHFTPSGWRV